MKRVYMEFRFRQGWYCQFWEEDRKTSLPRKVLLTDDRKLFEMAKRGGFTLNLAGRPGDRGGNQEKAWRYLAGAYPGAACEAAEGFVNARCCMILRAETRRSEPWKEFRSLAVLP